MNQLPPTIWWENDDGKRWVPTYDERIDMSPPPEGYRFMHVRCPLQIRHRVYDRTIQNGSSRLIAQMETTCNGALLLAMTRPSLAERIRTFFRKYPRQARYSPHDAVLIASIACERCKNVLAHRYGLKWGYAEGSQHWLAANTSCELCRHHGFENETTLQDPHPC